MSESVFERAFSAIKPSSFSFNGSYYEAKITGNGESILLSISTFSEGEQVDLPEKYTADFVRLYKEWNSHSKDVIRQTQRYLRWLGQKNRNVGIVDLVLSFIAIEETKTRTGIVCRQVFGFKVKGKHDAPGWDPDVFDEDSTITLALGNDWNSAEIAHFNRD
jgi:hypothetical protein